MNKYEEFENSLVYFGTLKQDANRGREILTELNIDKIEENKMTFIAISYCLSDDAFQKQVDNYA